MTTTGKKRHRHVAVFARSLDEIAQKLEDERNKLESEGYSSVIEEKELNNDEKGYAYMIHAGLVEEPSSAGFTGLPTLSQLRSMFAQSSAEGDDYSPKTVSFIKGVLAQVSRDLGLAIKEIPKVVPIAIKGLPLSDVSEIAAEIEEDLKKLGGAAHSEKCDMHRAFQVIAEALRENHKSNLQ